MTKNLVFFVKLAILIVYVIFQGREFSHRLQTLDSHMFFIFFGFLFALLFTALLCASLIERPFVRLFYGALLSISSFFSTSYTSVSNADFSYDSFLMMLASITSYQEAMDQHWSLISGQIYVSALLFIAIAINPKGYCTGRVCKVCSYLLVPISIVLLTFLLFFRGGEGARGVIPAFKSLAYFNLYLWDELNVIAKTNYIPAELPKQRLIKNDIIVVMDESVNPNYLDTSNHQGINTLLNMPHDNVTVFNYGYAVAATNCSDGSNRVVRYGGTRDDYNLKIRGWPSIWLYAKQSGMRTVYIDSQRTNGIYQNGMNSAEAKYIDDFIQFDDVSVVERDIEAARVIVSRLNNEYSEFIYVNKIGAHFPVADKYPNSHNAFQPTLPKNNHDLNPQSDVRSHVNGREESWRLYRNSYRNTLSWNVGEFFQVLFKSTSFSNSVVLYTSDHGQNLRENGNFDIGHSTHCNSSPFQDEGLVPFIAILGDSAVADELKINFQQRYNNSSHYNIFPTLLNFMGFDPKYIEQNYGASLFNSTKDPMTFNTRFYARLGKKPVWVPVDVSKSAVPSPKDYQK